MAGFQSAIYARPYADLSFFAGPVMAAVAVVTGIAAQEFPQDLREYARPAFVQDYQHGSVSGDDRPRSTFPEDQVFLRRTLPETGFTQGPVRANNDQGRQEFPTDIREYFKAPFLQDIQHGPVRANNREIASQEFPQDASAYLRRGYSDPSFWHGPVRDNNRELASQEFPTDVREYARPGLVGYDYSFFHGPLSKDNHIPPFPGTFPEDRAFERPGAGLNWGFTQAPYSVVAAVVVQPPEPALPENYARPVLDWGFQRGPVSTGDQGQQEFPVDLREYVRAPLPDYTHLQSPLRLNNRELASQEFPTDLKEYVKLGIDRDWSFVRGPVRDNNRELASQEFPQDASTYQRRGYSDPSFWHGPVRDNNRELASQEFPEDARLYVRPGLDRDWSFVLGPVRPNNDQGQQEFPADIRTFTRSSFADQGFTWSLAPKDAPQEEGEQQFPWDIGPYARPFPTSLLGFVSSQTVEDVPPQAETEQSFPWDIRPFSRAFPHDLLGFLSAPLVPPLPPGYIGPAGGSYAAYGASISFPPGCLDQVYRFSIGLPSDIVKAGHTTVGQCTSFTFPGTSFMCSASMAIPYAPPKIPVGRTRDDIVILVRDDSTGEVTVANPDSIDHTLLTVQFSASHLSSFQAAVASSPPAASPSAASGLAGAQSPGQGGAFQFRPTEADYRRRIRERAEAKRRAGRGLGAPRGGQDAAWEALERRRVRLEEEKRRLDEALAADRARAEARRRGMADLEALAEKQRETFAAWARENEERRRREVEDLGTEAEERKKEREERERADAEHEEKVAALRAESDARVKAIWDQARARRPSEEALALAREFVADPSADERRARIVIEALVGAGFVGLARATGHSTIPGLAALVKSIYDYWRLGGPSKPPG